MNPSWYRARLLLDVTRLFLLPSTVLTILLRLAGICLGRLTTLYYLLFIWAWTVMKAVYSNITQSKEAERFGAQSIPRIVGRWPGNVDILLRIVRAYKTDYLLVVYLELFQEYKSTTLNMRIFWMDHVRVFYFPDHPRFYQLC